MKAQYFIYGTFWCRVGLTLLTSEPVTHRWYKYTEYIRIKFVRGFVNLSFMLHFLRAFSCTFIIIKILV